MQYKILFVVLLGLSSISIGFSGVLRPLTVPVYNASGQLIGNLEKASTQTVYGVETVTVNVVDVITGDLIGVLTITGDTSGTIVDKSGNTVETEVSVAKALLNLVSPAVTDATAPFFDFMDGVYH